MSLYAFMFSRAASLMSLKELSKVAAKEEPPNEPATAPTDEAGEAKEGRGPGAALS